MRILKIAAILLLLPVMAFYFSTCSSAEQTTAKLAYQRGEFKKAEEEFMKELKTNPANEEAWFYLAMSRVMLKNVDGTKEAIEKYKGIKQYTFTPELINAWATLLKNGEKLYNEGDKMLQQKNVDQALAKFTEAAGEFQMAHVLLPDSAVAKENLDIINSQINSIAVKPLIDKGVEYEKQGNYEAAIGEYKKAMEKVKPGTTNYEIVIYDICLANLKWGEKMRAENSEDPAYKEKYKDGLPYLQELTKAKDVCTQYNSYMLLVQVYAILSMNDEAKDALVQRDKLKAEHPECLPDEGVNIEGGFTFKNVSFQQNDLFIKVMGEVTSSEKSYNTAIFKISFYGTNSTLIETVDFVVSNIQKGETKSFDAITTAKIKVSDIKSHKIQFDNGN